MNSLNRFALGSVAGAALLGAFVALPATAASSTKEKCAGIVKAGKNDCATKANSCAGHSTRDRQADAWIYIPSGTCAKIAGGRVLPK